MNTEKSIQKRSLNPVFDIENVGTENFYFEITAQKSVDPVSTFYMIYTMENLVNWVRKA